MPSNTRTEAAAPTGEDLAALFDELKASDQALRRAVRLAGELAGSGVCERVEGGSLEWAIGMVCRMTGADRRMIVAAGETLRDLPTVSQLWADALVSWSQIRSIVLAVRRLPVAKRREVDERVAASIRAYGGIDAFDADHLVEAVDAAAAELGDARAAERREQRAPAANFLSLQLSLEGRVRGYFDYDPVNGAIVINGLDAAAPPAEAAGDDDQTPRESHQAAAAAATRGRRYAQGLVEMAAEYLGGANSGSVGSDGKPRRRRRARPLLVAHTQTGDVTRGDGGIIQLNVRGRLARITAATLEILARDADIQAVIFDGARPLTVSKKLRAEQIPDDIRVAVEARDMSDRFPGSDDPIEHLHHIRHREHGGTNDVDNLGGFSTRSHLWRIHKLGWRISLDPATGIVTARRRNRAWRSLPRPTGLARPPDTRPPHMAPPSRHGAKRAGAQAPPTLPF